MGKSNYSKTTPMTAVEKRLRDAEAASVRELLRKAPVVHEMTSTSTLRTVKIKDAKNTETSAASKVQAAMRGFVARRDVAALKAAVAASDKEAAAAAVARRVKAELESWWAKLMMGQRLDAAAMVRGDLKALVAMYGPAASTIARAMRAFVRKQAAQKKTYYLSIYTSGSAALQHLPVQHLHSTALGTPLSFLTHKQSACTHRAARSRLVRARARRHLLHKSTTHLHTAARRQ